MANRMNFFEMEDFYTGHLMYHVMPFWLKHGLIDWENGGLWTGIKDDGTIITRDKFIWSNTRALYTFSALYNHMGKDVKWLKAADNIFEFLKKRGRTPDKKWGYLVDEKGAMIEGEKAIQVDAFAIMGLTEYFLATGNEDARRIAFETYESTSYRLAHPGTYGTFPYPIPEGAKAHRDHFQFAYAYYNLALATGREDIKAEALRHANEVMDNFRKPEKKALLELIADDNTFLDTPAGRTFNPGHAIESMWFMIEIFLHEKNAERVQQAVEVIRWALEKGWDNEYGGLFLAIDIKGMKPLYWKNPEKKLWWVFSETLYALLLSYKETRQPWCMDWYWKIHNWAFSHFPLRREGEWTQKLNRDGSVFDGIVALPVKDPFHLPRALIKCVECLREMNAGA